NADFPQSFRPQRVDDLVPFLHEDHLDVVHVGVHRNVILREVVVHETSEGVVEETLLFEGRADAADDGAEHLAPRRLRIEDTPGGDGTDNAGNLDSAEVFI